MIYLNIVENNPPFELLNQDTPYILNNKHIHYLLFMRISAIEFGCTLVDRNEIYRVICDFDDILLISRLSYMQ